jgi:hypothetical protein
VSNVISLRKPKPRTRIVGSPFEGGFRYLVFPDDQSPDGLLPADSLADARGMAAFFSDTVIEMGPPEAFGRAPA